MSLSSTAERMLTCTASTLQPLPDAETPPLAVCTTSRCRFSLSWHCIKLVTVLNGGRDGSSVHLPSVGQRLARQGEHSCHAALHSPVKHLHHHELANAVPLSCIWTVPTTDLQLTRVYVKQPVELIARLLAAYKAVVAHGETIKKPHPTKC